MTSIPGAPLNCVTLLHYDLYCQGSNPRHSFQRPQETSHVVYSTQALLGPKRLPHPGSVPC